MAESRRMAHTGGVVVESKPARVDEGVMTQSQLQRELARVFEDEFDASEVAFSRSGESVRAQWRSVTVLATSKSAANTKLRAAVKDALAVRIERSRAHRAR